jgi:hypothetical protein
MAKAPSSREMAQGMKENIKRASSMERELTLVLKDLADMENGLTVTFVVGDTAALAKINQTRSYQKQKPN